MSRTSTHANRHLTLALKLMALVLLLHVEACATTSAEGLPEELGPQEGVQIRVENLNDNDVEVFLHLSGDRNRLGRVTRGGLEFFDFEWPIGRPLDVEIVLTTGERFRVPPPNSTGGGQVYLTVASELRQSVIGR